MNNKLINVSLGILYCPIQQTILLSSRPNGKTMAGHWEFPGGKLEAEENCFQALQRELIEELSIRTNLTDMQLLDNLEYQYPHGLVRLHVILVKQWSGEISLNEEQQIHWLKIKELSNAPQPLLPTTTRVFELFAEFLTRNNLCNNI
ncbi:MAG: hypothetical protein RLZZ293_113 [Pseudomonadota bacterium]|jgi:8-oxo-dGTP diphosphatase